MQWEDEDGMSIDEEEVAPSHNLQDMPWDNSCGESPAPHSDVALTWYQCGHTMWCMCGMHASTSLMPLCVYVMMCRVATWC